MERYMKSRAKCPKCGSHNLDIIETIEAEESFVQTNGIIDREGNKEYGDIFRVEGVCHKCLHRWRFRGISSMSDLFDEPKLFEL